MNGKPSEKTDIYEGCKPENALESGLARFMAEHLLRSQRPGPSSQQSQKMQQVFGYAPGIATRCGFVESVEKKGRDAGRGVEGECSSDKNSSGFLFELFNAGRMSKPLMPELDVTSSAAAYCNYGAL